MGLAFAAVSDADPRLFRLGLPLCSIVWVAVIAGAVGGGPVERVFSVPVLRWIGERSYGIYLFHVPIIELTDWSAAEVVAVTLLAAELSHRLVEAPIRREASMVPALVAALAVVGSSPYPVSWPSDASSSPTWPLRWSTRWIPVGSRLVCASGQRQQPCLALRPQ